MLQCQNSVKETHYDVLSVKENASYEEVRTSYKTAILNYHPDKLQNKDKTSVDQIELGDKFLKIQKAWEVLSNSRSRAVYDSELRSSRNDTGVAEEVGLEDMMVEDGGELLELHYQCRCGDYYSVDCLELEKMGHKLSRYENEILFETDDSERASSSVILPCGTCSLLIRLVIDTDKRIQIDV